MLIFGWWGAVIWGIQMLWIPFWAAGVINGVAHYVGYRNYDTKENSHNILPWGILIGGEELHNNHHQFPASAKFERTATEFDIGWFWIEALETVGLITTAVQSLPLILDDILINFDDERSQATLSILGELSQNNQS